MMNATPNPAARPSTAPPIPSVLGIPLLVLLAIEFLLGMGLNLFVALPSGSPATILATTPLLDVHIVVGVMLLGLLGRVLVLGVRRHDRWVALAGAVGLGSGAGAFLAGLAFAFGGGNAVASYVMSIGFAGLLFSAAVLLRPRTSRIAESTSDRPTTGSDPGSTGAS